MEEMTDQELERIARRGHHPGLLVAVLRYCKFNGRPEIAMMAIRNPNIDPGDLLSLIKEGKDALYLVNSYRSFGGLWWQYTEGLRNPRIAELLRDASHRQTLSRIVETDAASLF